MRYRFLRFPDGRTKAVTLSYDDGCRADLRLSEIINRYGIKCTFNLNSGFLGKSSNDSRLTKEEIAQHLLGTGHEIAVHGDLHRANGNLRPIDGIRDVLDCRLKLEKEFGIIIRGMAYPDSGITRMQNGAIYNNIKGYLEDLDIVYSRTLAGDNNSFSLPVDWHAWMPTAHHKNPKVLQYIDEFVSMDINGMYCASRHPRLFYLWGHAYEFDNDNNWDLFENICTKFSKDDDIWFATNIDIYNYVKAYQSLVFSADGSIVYNPTLLEIWFNIDGKPYSIKSGETIHI